MFQTAATFRKDCYGRWMKVLRTVDLLILLSSGCDKRLSTRNAFIMKIHFKLHCSHRQFSPKDLLVFSATESVGRSRSPKTEDELGKEKDTNTEARLIL